jgi:hypothetical protein
VQVVVEVGAPQVPLWHASPWVQALPSLQVVPSEAGTRLQVNRVGSHWPTWHAAVEGQSTSATQATQTPASTSQ